MDRQTICPDSSSAETFPLVLGSPRFADPVVEQMSQAQGLAQAWCSALDRMGAEAAAASAQGVFAVALQLDAGRRFMATDRFGICTLCWRMVDGQLHVAERADTLAKLPGTPPAQVDAQAIFDYLYLHAIPSPRTIFKGVHRLPPGHYGLLENGELKIAPYWRPSFEKTRPGSFKALREEFRGILHDSVATALAGHRPACFLSGGTDSSTVAGVAREVSGTAPASYSIGFEAQGYDEMAYARIAAKHFGTQHHEYYVTPADLVKSIPDVAVHYDQPFGNSSSVPAFYCARMAREDGHQRILAGDGGDELFGGNTRYAKQTVFGWYEALPSTLLEPLLLNRVARGLPLLRKASSYVEQARVPMPDRLQSYNLLQRLGLENVLSDALLAQVDPEAPRHGQAEQWARVADGTSLLNKMLAFDWRYTLAENDLPKVIGTAGLAGIEVGFPLLDTRLLDFSAQLPDDYKLRRLKLRWFFKEALRGFLPDEILTKKKHGFGLPFGVWAHRDANLHKLASESLHSLDERGILRPGFVQTLLHEHLPARPGYYGEMIWILMMLEQWLQGHAPTFRL